MGSVGIGPCDIIDIRQGDLNFDLAGDIHSLLNPSEAEERQLPTLLLYDEAGLKLFEDITYLEEYYLTNAEIKVLEENADAIAALIPNDAQLIELGSGNLRKVNILLKALERAQRSVDYYALDLSRPELERTLNDVLPGTYKHVRCHGLWGTYDNGLAWLSSSDSSNRTKVVMTLGSSIGNFTRDSATCFLRSFAQQLRPSDMMIVGVDGCDKSYQVYAAYNDQEGVTEKFYRNGLEHANRVLGYELFRQEDWEIVGRFDACNGLHEAFISPLRDIHDKSFQFKTGELIRFENAFKYVATQQVELWAAAGLVLRASYTSSYHAVNVLSPEAMHSDLQPTSYAKEPVPSIKEFQELWKSWDLISLGMLPTEELLSTPIYLRNCCIFYLGHIPTFLDIQLSKSTGLEPTKQEFNKIFERGIDPDVDNPALCHNHSAIPDTWPNLTDILEYQKIVRARTIRILEEGRDNRDLKVAKALWLSYEHEVMHLETYLYMLLQSDKVLPPPGPRPDFHNLATQAQMNKTSNPWINVAARKVTIGQDKNSRFFTWDNEKPARTSHVDMFQVRSSPITNRDYIKFLLSRGEMKTPATWMNQADRHDSDQTLLNGHTNTDFAAFIEDKAVRTVYGPVPLQLALDWPVMGSYDELSACALFLGGRIPSIEESKSIHVQIEEQNPKKDNSVLHATEPDLFTDLTDSNVGLRNFHPVPVSLYKDHASGIAPMGGAWEWTSTVLRKWDGFDPMPEYPEYTADFFDEKHNIVVGGSWATMPRVAGRRSFINWYQRNYPYAWIGARVVRDVPLNEGA